MSPDPPKPVVMSVQPFQVAHLCFETGGILQSALADLGTQVKKFDFPALYKTLGGVPAVAGDPSLLLYDVTQIDTYVGAFALAALRNEARKVDLNTAIKSRQNSYFAKYANAPAIIARMNTYYSETGATAKPQRLRRLTSLATQQWNLLNSAYNSYKRTGVVTTTNSVLCSDTTSYGYSATGGISEELSFSAGILHESDPIPKPPDPPGPWQPPAWPRPCGTTDQSEEHWTYQATGTSQAGGATLPSPQPPPAPVDLWAPRFTGDREAQVTVQKGASYQATSNADRGRQSQTIVNTDYGYRVPYIEAEAQFQRAQISLIDQQFAQFMSGQSLPHLAQVFQNELNSIDGNVFRLQIAYLNTILMSPIDGYVTGVYKNPGDAVRPGETVIRVEDHHTIYLVATVIYRGPIAIGSVPPAPPVPNSTVTINTKLFGGSSLANPLNGTVVSARGHRDEDKWDLVVKCDNRDPLGNPIFPVGYRFDYDDTQISIS